jgi:biotin-dependent carboxylase-like uncharacterized protein
MITVLETPPLNTVQDLGRFGYRHLGVGTSGAMDGLALQTGNTLLFNPHGEAGIEVQTYPFVVRFEEETCFVVTGADNILRLDESNIAPWFVRTARAGQTLHIGPPRQGARAYLCVAGGIDVPRVLGSRSTQLRGSFGGVNGRSLRKGDVLMVGVGAHCGNYGALSPSIALPNPGETLDGSLTSLRAIPAADHDLFPEDARERFWATNWKISSQSDRTGYRLKGDPVLLQEPLELRSYGLVAGIVQVPPSGRPIVQMADANTAGGYPRMATVIEADLWRLGQARIGSYLRFLRVGHDEGVKAMEPIRHYLYSLHWATSQKGPVHRKFTI